MDDLNIAVLIPCYNQYLRQNGCEVRRLNSV